MAQRILEKIPEDFEEKRRIGENDSFICELIRKDLIEEFIVHMNKNNISLNSIIEESIFETNSTLLRIRTNRNIFLIEYAAFFGSIQIFKYLFYNANFAHNVNICAIHSQNPELIHFLKENEKDSILSMSCLMESIKCHHNEISNFLLSEIDQDKKSVFLTSIKYYNFAFIDKDWINKNFFYELCRSGYFTLVSFILKNEDVNLNELVI